MIGVRAPDEFESPDGSVIPLFSNPRREEEAYYGDTGVFPIMHLVALRRDVYDSHPWLAMNLYSAFLKAKRRSVRRALETTASRYPLPWGAADARRAQRVFGGDLWPYGIDDNRATLAAFLEFAHEQGVCGARLTADELFPAEVRPAVRI